MLARSAGHFCTFIHIYVYTIMCIFCCAVRICCYFNLIFVINMHFTGLFLNATVVFSQSLRSAFIWVCLPLNGWLHFAPNFKCKALDNTARAKAISYMTHTASTQKYFDHDRTQLKVAPTAMILHLIPSQKILYFIMKFVTH